MLRSLVGSEMCIRDRSNSKHLTSRLQTHSGLQFRFKAKLELQSHIRGLGSYTTGRGLGQDRLKDGHSCRNTERDIYISSSRRSGNDDAARRKHPYCACGNPEYRYTKYIIGDASSTKYMYSEAPLCDYTHVFGDKLLENSVHYFSSRRRHTRCSGVSWARRCV